MKQLRGFDLDVGNAVVLNGAQCGDLGGDVVLLLHGYSDSWQSYRPFIEALPDDLAVVAPSMRGHGLSSKPEATYGTKDFASDVAALLDRLGVGRVHIVGHSMGSLIATALAAQAPERVRSLALIGGFATLKNHPGIDELWRDAVSSLEDPVDPAFVREFQESTLARPVPEAFIAEIVAESLQLPARVWRSVLGALLDEDFSRDLESVVAPTLVIRGEHDELADCSEADRLTAAIRGARLVTITGGGHAPHWEDPTHVAQLVSDFVQSVR